MNATLLSFALLLSLSPTHAGQTPAPRKPDAARQETAEAADDLTAQRRQTLFAELRALEAESKELLKPLDAASAKAEIGAAAWTLEREWAKSLLREALVETAAKARITSELGNPNFNPEAFARLSGVDAGRARSAAGRLEDRVQRLAALAAACRGEAEQLEKEAAARRR